ncbi:hypothetical protein SAMN05216567_10686 [Variovorax sp. OK605]|jgi:hypothetical protein|uniref:hypothetical protein n=1 Tax=unclassified Variovorax TaxID=663243 RepID=UPI0008C7F3B8|nr:MULTISPECIES: hypothetical protein [unclassified Variovorax]SEJ94423.1 hypothetical protein SAMN05518853_10545 [Variovorax sp. OK202]SFD17881.1 hypothetical protein SAMN05444746_10585 [Variovorax sp. OK212]SFP42020.1 hypothetical protein SAMN05216567_10686 [Variovorax sp. OK605]
MTSPLPRSPSRMRPLAAAAFCGAVLLGALSAVASAQAAVNPPIFMSHGIEYMSGGIGSDEAQLMETVSPRWPATLEFAVKDSKGADFAANVHVTVRDGSGTALIDNVTSGGPFMVARLDPGNYEVEARLGNQVLKQPLHVLQGAPSKVSFVWPAGTDMASAGTRTVQ